MKISSAKNQNQLLNAQVIKNGRMVLRAVDHPVRQQILQVINKAGEINVTDIYIKLRLEQSVTSQHLALLRKAGVVHIRRQGKCIYYSINHQRVKEIEESALSLQVF